MKTPTERVGVDQLHAEFDRAAIALCVLIAGGWAFAAWSYFLSGMSGADWFARSGSVMALIGAITTFRAVNIYQKKLVTALNGGLVSVEREVQLALDPPRSFQILSYLGYLTGGVGTVIWGYGDLLPRALP
jgi:hypothetical protein